MDIITNKILNYEYFGSVDKDIQAFTKMLISLTKYLNERTTYYEIKTLMKEALILAQDLKLKSLIAHNLAVINYSEV